MKILRQGDVLILPVSQIPEDATPTLPENGKIILAHGEVTGHAHTINEINGVVKFEASGKTFLKVLEEVGLNHEEHDPFVIPIGTYQILIQTEYTPGEYRNVQD